jgi:hypothetical protein
LLADELICNCNIAVIIEFFQFEDLRILFTLSFVEELDLVCVQRSNLRTIHSHSAAVELSLTTTFGLHRESLLLAV